jgi:hypothetical protein
MTSTAPARASEPLWGIGSYDDGTTRVPWEISQAEIQRDMGAAARLLASLDLGSGSRVLICSMLSEAGQFWPLTVGAMLTGAQLSCADASEGDAVRVEMFTRLVGYTAVFGVTGAILDGLDSLGRTYADVFGGIRIVGARPDAYARLVAAELAPHHFVVCGPMIAVGPEPAAPARHDDAEWSVDVDGDRLAVTSLQPRATTFTRAPTAVRGALVLDGFVPTTTTKEERA